MKNSEFAAKRNNPSEGKPLKNTPVHAFLRFIERRQSDVIGRILRHCGLWEEVHSDDRGPPDTASIKEAISDHPQGVAGWSYEPDPDFVPHPDF